MDKKLNILVVSSLQYPNGGAAASRHLALVKGLTEINNKIFFVLTSSQKDKNVSFLKNLFIHYCPTNLNKNNLKLSILNFLKYLKKLKQTVYEINNESKLDVIIILDTQFWEILPILFIAKKIRIKVIHERTEFPFVVEQKNFLGKLNSFLYNNCIINKFDGLFVITNALKKYFENQLEFKKPITIINMFVDPERFLFSVKNNKLFDQNYIAYCGNMEGEKDGVDILIRAFGYAINNYSSCKNLKLKLIGDTTNKILLDRLKNLAEEASCLSQIEFTGKLESSKMPEVLYNAKALLLSRPNNMQAIGGFPTKLGEYLATGNPVIVTEVGEINHFLKNNYSVFFAKPDNVELFAKQIKNVFDDYDNALIIAREGKKLIFSDFNYRSQAQKLEKFIESIIR